TSGGVLTSPPPVLFWARLRLSDVPELVEEDGVDSDGWPSSMPIFSSTFFSNALEAASLAFCLSFPTRPCALAGVLKATTARHTTRNLYFIKSCVIILPKYAFIRSRIRLKKNLPDNGRRLPAPPRRTG